MNPTLSLEDCRAQAGEILSDRTPYWLNLFVKVFFAIVFALGAFVLVIHAVHTLQSSQPVSGASLAMHLLGAALLAAGAVMIVMSIFTLTEFRLKGVISHRFGKVRSCILYSDATSLTYELARQYVNGAYSGTTVRVRIKAPGARTISFSTRHKERSVSKGMFGLKRAIEGTDELDEIKRLIASCIVERWTSGPPDWEHSWGGVATLTPKGIITKRGRRKGQLIPYADVVSVTAKQGWVSVWFTGDTKRGSLDLQTGSENFWPGIELVSLLSQQPDLDSVLQANPEQTSSVA